jgi:hypothetical protein
MSIFVPSKLTACALNFSVSPKSQKISAEALLGLRQDARDFASRKPSFRFKSLILSEGSQK